MNTSARLLAATACGTLAMIWASPALAQQPDDQTDQQAQPTPADQPPAPPQEIVIVGSQVNLTRPFAGGEVARGSRAGLLGNLDNMESPFSSTAFTAKLIKEQQAQSVGDVLKNEPGVEVARGFGNFQQVYIVRGFPVFSDDMTYNGVYGILPREFVASEFLERVEIFRGANSFLNGASPGGSAVAGMVNLVPKRAPNDPLLDLTVGGGNIGQGYAAVDVARRFGPSNSFGVRANLAGRFGQTEIHHQDQSLLVASLGLDYRTSTIRFTADAGYQYQKVKRARPSVTPTGEAPRPPKASSNFAQPWTFAKEKELFGAFRGEADLTDSITAWAAVGGRRGTEENDLANPTASPSGATSAFRFHNYRKDGVISADAGVRANMKFGEDVDNRVILSGQIFNVSSRNAFDFFFTPIVSDLYDPIDNPRTEGGFVFSGGVLDNPHVTFTTNTKSAAVADMLQAFDKAVTAIIGVRYQRIDNASFDFNTGDETSRVVGHAWTPGAGLVVRPIKPLSLFLNYSQALVPGAVAPSTANGLPVLNAGEVFAPFRAKQYEGGAKVDLGNFGGSLAIFQIELPSAFVEDQVFSVSGKQRNRGVELNTYGEPMPGLRVVGGLTYLNAKILKAANPAINGRYAIGVPKWQQSLNVEYDIPRTALTAEGHITHKGSQYIDGTNTFKIPGFTTFDAGARYKLALQGDRSVTLRARVENIGNKNYWGSAGGFPGSNYLVLGEPRTYWLSASVDLH